MDKIELYIEEIKNLYEDNKDIIVVSLCGLLLLSWIF